MKKFKCPFCGDVKTEASALYMHMERKHIDLIPQGMTVSQYYFIDRTGKTHGNCVVCRDKTEWNESTSKYHRFCDKPSCKETYIEEFKRRMIGKHGKTTLLNDPTHQRKMLANRSISGKYKFADGGEVTYTGSYEKDFLTFLNVFMNFVSKDVMGPSPHTYEYMYEGKPHFYIPDFFIPSLNLEIEIKDGGDNPNNHHKIQDVDKKKEAAKDAVMASQKGRQYIKVINKEYDGFIDYLMDRKKSLVDPTMPQKVIVSESTGITESTTVMKLATEVGNSRKDSPVILTDLLDYVNSKGINDTSPLTASIMVPNLEHIVLRGLKDNMYASMNMREDIKSLINMIEGDDESGIFIEDTKEIIILLRSAIEDGLCDEDENQFKYVLGVLLTEIEDLHEEEKIKSKKSIALESSDETKLYPVYVILTHSGTSLANAIKAVTKVPYSHSSISFDSSLKNMYSFGRKYKSNPLIGTFVKESLDKGLYEDVADKTTYSLYVTYVDKAMHTAMKSKLSEFEARTDLKYNFTGLITMKMGIERERENAYFCSEFVDTILKASGQNFTGKHSSMVQPYDFAKNKNFHFVMKGILSHYNASEVEKRTKKIYEEKMS